jgi:hypothetical protein
MKIFSNIVLVLTMLVVVAGIANIEFPYRKPLLYGLLAYVLIVDLLIPLIKKKD